MQSLAEFQREFAAAIRAPAPLGSAGATGIAIHRNTVMKGLIDALCDNFPTVGVLMGREWMTAAALAYAQVNAPRHAVLATYGERFPDFLRGREEARPWPYLSGVAHLDRLWITALLAEDAPTLCPERLAGLAPEALASLRLRLHPSASFGVFGESAVAVWRANRPPAIAPEELHVDGRDEVAVVVRNASGVQVSPLDTAAHAFLQTIAAGGMAADAAAAALVCEPDADVARIWSVLLLQGVFADINSNGD